MGHARKEGKRYLGHDGSEAIVRTGCFASVASVASLFAFVLSAQAFTALHYICRPTEFFEFNEYNITSKKAVKKFQSLSLSLHDLRSVNSGL